MKIHGGKLATLAVKMPKLAAFAWCSQHVLTMLKATMMPMVGVRKHEG